MTRFLKVLLLSVSTVVVGCSDDDGDGHDDHEDDAGQSKCEEIGSVCHVLDAGSDVADCHELGHLGDTAVCEARYDECISMCRALDAGPGH